MSLTGSGVMKDSEQSHRTSAPTGEHQPAAKASVAIGGVSVVVPVKNEEQTIARLLEGLCAQTRLPDEIVITDGGSVDGTREVIRRFREVSPVPIELIETSHALPGRGRNLALVRASNEWVACIDAGIVPHRSWLAELIAVAEREPEAQIVFGRYEAVTDSFFTECAAMVCAPVPGSLTRSIASCLMQRAAWHKAGGFREDLRSAEDLLFFRSLEAADVRAAYTRDAVVYWSLNSTARSTFRHFTTYSRHNLKAGLFREWQLRVLIRYALFAATFVVGLVWCWPLLLLPPIVLLLRAARRVYHWHGNQNRARMLKAVLNPRRIFGVAWVSLIIDMAMFRGMLEWLLKRDQQSLPSS